MRLEIENILFHQILKYCSRSISEMLMETGEIPVQCRCCVGGVFFIMPLEQLFREGGESEDAQVRIQALNVSDSLRATAQQIIYHGTEYRFLCTDKDIA